MKPCLDQTHVHKHLSYMLHNSSPKLATPTASVRPSHLFISHINAALRLACARPPNCEDLESNPPHKAVVNVPTARNEVRMGRSAMPLQRKFAVFPRATGGLYSGTFQNKYLLPRRCCHLPTCTCRFRRSARTYTKLLPPSYCNTVIQDRVLLLLEGIN